MSRKKEILKVIAQRLQYQEEIPLLVYLYSLPYKELIQEATKMGLL